MKHIKDKIKKLLFFLLTISLRSAAKEQKLQDINLKLRKIVPNLKDQYSSFIIEGDYLNTKVYAQHAFQVKLTLEALNLLDKNKHQSVLVDIGDSSGTHITYLESLVENIDALSVNSDPIAVEKIKAKGLSAFKSRAESLHLHEDFDKEIDIMISFEMLEHLKNPIEFLEVMAKEAQCNKFVITVPLVKRSRVALDKLNNMSGPQAFNPEVTHIFELSPKHWDKIFKFSGWKIIHNQEYYQYPKLNPLRFSKFLWKKFDFEGFYGVVLEKDDTYSSQYQDY